MCIYIYIYIYIDGQHCGWPVHLRALGATEGRGTCKPVKPRFSPRRSDKSPLWERHHESRRCSRDTYPESYITKYTSIRRLSCSLFARRRGTDRFGDSCKSTGRVTNGLSISTTTPASPPTPIVIPTIPELLSVPPAGPLGARVNPPVCPVDGDRGLRVEVPPRRVAGVGSWSGRRGGVRTSSSALLQS